ncbi:hypothetical protein HPB49_021266 [Dermacentor silvarum]|uniref:Uncharacterized protein n=1 Tax=Dermacentor silvarum TaxID=543639 RepID=A0ACB8DKW5_DERSI|nr:hypothetical protein HPB49_021266 [Dermacentor silvarum]
MMRRDGRRYAKPTWGLTRLTSPPRTPVRPQPTSVSKAPPDVMESPAKMPYRVDGAEKHIKSSTNPCVNQNVSSGTGPTPRAQKNCKVRFERAGNAKPSRLTGHQQHPSTTSDAPEASKPRDSHSKFRSSSKRNSGSPSRCRSRSTPQKGSTRSRSSSFPLLPGRKDQPTEKQGRSLFILNVYSPPKSRAAPLIRRLPKTLDISGRQPLGVVGDINANHTSWGYKQTCRKGTTLGIFIQNEGLSLMNDLDHPTLIGNSIQLNTSPDLTLTKNINHSKWSNTHTSLGSDHFILSSEIPTQHLAQRSKRTAAIVDWDKFRVIRTSAP